MKSSAIALVVASFSMGAAFGGELTPDWLPPLPPRGSVWDSFQDETVHLPGQEFSEVLFLINGASATASRTDLDRFKVSNTSDTNFGKVSTSLDLPDPRDPRALPYRDWKSNQSLNLPSPVSESIFMFGNVDSSGNSLDHQAINMTGRTGVGVKWSPFGGSELQVRTGTLLSYADTLSSTTKSTERSQLSVALQAKLDLFGPLQLQYSGEALPAMSQTDHRTLLTDFKLAMPLGSNQEFSIGAKYKWEDTLTPTPWVDRAQLYLGLRFQR